jgi:endonuclease/exonuclease/phosphatase family metal-dependent hydrolase
VAVTEAVAGHGDDRVVILTGDLNDTSQAATSQLLLGPPGSNWAAKASTGPDQGDRTRMWNLAPLMPEGRNYSRNNQGRHELIDHILVSRAALGSPEAITVQAVIDTTMPSVDPTEPNTRRNASASEHAPVVATLPTI